MEEWLDDTKLIDNYCSSILTLIWYKREMRFNEIYRALKEKGIQLSKPTLSDHLKHLVKQKFITRKPKGVQNVTYSLHKSIKRTSEAELWEFIKSTGAEVIEPTPEARASFALKGVIEMKLRELLLRIDIEPNINRRLTFGSTQAKSFEEELIRDCRKDEKYKIIILKEIQQLLSIIANRAVAFFGDENE